jgi:hypothetical protein
MSTSSKWLPLSVIALGAMLVIAAVAIPLLSKTISESTSAPIPDQINGLSITSEATGRAALQEFSELHGKSFPVLSGAKASYGPGSQITIWVAGTDSSSATRQLLESMRDKIAQGNSPFQPIAARQEGNRTVYALDGMGQKHFYFQSEKNLIWLAASPELADQALQEALNFYR